MLKDHGLQSLSAMTNATAWSPTAKRIATRSSMSTMPAAIALSNARRVQAAPLSQSTHRATKNTTTAALG